MRAITIEQSEDTPVLRLSELPMPSIGAQEVLVEVKATAVNRADLMQVQGLYPPPAGASEILGLEVSGLVSEVGSSVRNFSVGDRVMALLPGGGYAQYTAVPESLLIRIPKDWTFEEAAGFPEVYFTAYLNLFEMGELKAKESVLIHSGASGVGTAAIQLAKAFGAVVYATAGSDEKCKSCLSLGAELAINYKEEDFAEKIRSSARSGVSLVLDTVGASYLKSNCKVLAQDGRLLLIGLLGGSKAEINLGAVLMKRLTIRGSTLRNRSLDEKAKLCAKIKTEVIPLFAEGTLRHQIDRVFPIEQAQAAHDYVRDNLNTGKVVLRFGDRGAVTG